MPDPKMLSGSETLVAKVAELTAPGPVAVAVIASPPDWRSVLDPTEAVALRSRKKIVTGSAHAAFGATTRAHVSTTFHSCIANSISAKW